MSLATNYYLPSPPTATPKMMMMEYKTLSPIPQSPLTLSRTSSNRWAPSPRPTPRHAPMSPLMDMASIPSVPPTPLIRVHSDEHDSSPGSPPSPFPTSTPIPRHRTILHKVSTTFKRASIEGTPPPAVRFLHPDDAPVRAHPVTAKFTNSPRVRQRDVETGSVNRDLGREKARSRSSWRASSYRTTSVAGTSVADEDEIGDEEDEANSRYDDRYSQYSQSPSQLQTPTHSRHNSSSPRDESERKRLRRAARRRRDDPLAVLERRRRRDFTIGSHNPSTAPPPSIMGESMLEPNPDEQYQRDSGDSTWSSYFHQVWGSLKRIHDMPWMAEPIVATLVIPQQLAKEVPDTWYRPRGWSDEMADRDSAEMAMREMNAGAGGHQRLQIPSPAYAGIWKGRRDETDRASWNYSVNRL